MPHSKSVLPSESDRTCRIQLFVIFGHWFLLLGDCFGFAGIELTGDAVGPIIFRLILACIAGMEDLNEVGKTDGFAKNEQ